MDNFGAILFVSMSYKKCCILFEMFKDLELFSSQYTDFIDSGKNYQVHVFVVIHKISNRQLHTQLSQKIQRFRIYIKTKNAPFFMNFPNIFKKMATIFRSDWFFKRILLKFFAQNVHFARVKSTQNLLICIQILL